MRDICIIGAGIVGASVAYHLSQSPDVRVTIVDAGFPGAGTTEAGTGWITARGSKDIPYRQLRLLGMEEHRRLADIFSFNTWLNAGGTLQSQDADEHFEAVVEDCKEVGFPVELYTARQVNAQLERNLVFNEPDMLLAHFPTEFTVMGAEAARALTDAAINTGAVGHFGSRVTAIELTEAHKHNIIFNDGSSFQVDVVVNAAGAKADQIAAYYGIYMPLAPQPGMTIRALADGNPLSRMFIMKDLVIKPERPGVVRLRSLMGWKTTDGSAATANSYTGGMARDDFIDFVISQARATFHNHLNLRPYGIFSGVRPIPADGLPRVGAVASVPGYYDAVMHSGGTLGPLIGRILADEILTGETDDILSTFRPDRFLTTQSTQSSETVGSDEYAEL